MGPVEAGAGEELDVAAIDARVHAVAIVLDFMKPAGSGGRFVNEARQLRLDPFWRPIGFSHDAQCSIPRFPLKSRRNMVVLLFHAGRGGGEPMRSNGRPWHGGRVPVCEDNVLMADVVCEFLRECHLRPMGPVGRLESAVQMAPERALGGAILRVNLNGPARFSI